MAFLSASRTTLTARYVPNTLILGLELVTEQDVQSSALIQGIQPDPFNLIVTSQKFPQARMFWTIYLWGLQTCLLTKIQFSQKIPNLL